MKLFIGACRLWCRERHTPAPPQFSALGSQCVHTFTCTYTHVQMSAEQEFLSVSCLHSHQTEGEDIRGMGDGYTACFSSA